MLFDGIKYPAYIFFSAIDCISAKKPDTEGSDAVLKTIDRLTRMSNGKSCLSKTKAFLRHFRRAATSFFLQVALL